MKRIVLILVVIVIVGGLYALTLRGVPGNPAPADFKQKLDQQTQPFELSPERGRYVHLVALAATGRYNLSTELAEAAFPDVGVYNGKFYSFFAPGLPYLALPMYLIGAHFHLAQVGSFAFIALVSMLALWFLFRIAREILGLPTWAALVAIGIFAFGSTAWSYAITLYQHHVTTFFMVSSLYAVWRYRRGGRGSFWWAAFATVDYALALTIDYPNALLLLPVMIYLALSVFTVQRREAKITFGFRTNVFVAVGLFAVVTAVHLYHNQVYFGSWHHLSGGLQSYRFVDPTLDPIKAATAITPQDLNAQKNIVGFFKEERLPFSSYTLFISPDRGLLVYAPIFILALFGIWWSYRRRWSMEVAVLLSLITVNVFLYSSWGDPWGGWAYGPRYLIPSMALLSLFIGVAVAQWRRYIWPRIVTWLLFVYSSGVALLGAVTTNAVPPKIEADFLHSKYNFLFNWDVLRDGRSGSYLYTTYFSAHISLQHYYLLILGFVSLIMLVLLIIIPSLKRHD